jgi:hypothetical protein
VKVGATSGHNCEPSCSASCCCRQAQRPLRLMQSNSLPGVVGGAEGPKLAAGLVAAAGAALLRGFDALWLQYLARGRGFYPLYRISRSLG